MLLVSFLVFQRFFSAFAMTKDCCKDTNFFGNNAKRGKKERRKLLQQGRRRILKSRRSPFFHLLDVNFS
jgi:hypothetical protein